MNAVMERAVEKSNRHQITLEEMIARSDKERGYPIPKNFETELLIKRVKDGGQSGDFLAQAFLSAYGMSDFHLSLGQLINIDAEGMRLFQQICHLRHIKGWNDRDYNDLAGKIETIVKKAG